MISILLQYYNAAVRLKTAACGGMGGGGIARLGF